MTGWAFSYELEVGGKSYNPCRVDTTHGYAHLDVVGADGSLIEKIPLGEVPPERASAILEEIAATQRRRLLTELGVDD